jgi:hypothetical protein
VPFMAGSVEEKAGGVAMVAPRAGGKGGAGTVCTRAGGGRRRACAVRAGELEEGIFDGWGPDYSAGRQGQTQVKNCSNKFEFELKLIQTLTSPKRTFSLLKKLK